MPQKLKNLLQTTVKNPKMLMVVGIIGILLIGCSSLFSGQKKEESAPQQTTAFSAQDYARTLEISLKKSISDMLGSDRVSVLITLDSGVEYVYADEIKQSNENEIDTDKTQQKDSNEKNYVLFRDEDGNEVPLTVTEIMPRIKGVVVVCEGGDNEMVRQIVTSAVTTALDVADTRVCVTGYSLTN